MTATSKQAVIDFAVYPPVGQDDWRYAFAAAEVRALETQMLSHAALADLANAENFAAAGDLLSATEYSVNANAPFEEVETMLLERRTAVRELFKQLIDDEPLVELLREKDDFNNLRLAIRRTVTDQPIGADYSNEGSVPADMFGEIFEQENYALLPEHMQEAVEEGVLAYYQDKNIRDIDFALDAAQARYKLNKAIELNNKFLESLFRLQIDIANIRTMLRLKFTESELRNVFLEGGFLEIDRFKHGLDIGYEAIPALFLATPYHEIIDSGIGYLNSNQSFLKLEQKCDDYVNGFLRSTSQITAGPQPVIAYVLLKEGEIRNVRLILTAKKNSLDKQLILDRVA